MRVRCSANAAAALVLLGGLAGFLGGNEAAAVVTQLDGTVLPAAPAPVETNPAGVAGCLAWREGTGGMSPTFDAAVTPEVLLPNPGSPTVTFRLLAEGGGYRNSFGWYNVGDDVTNPANLHVVFDCRTGGSYDCSPAGRPAGWPRTAAVTFTTGVGRPYKGGYIGFWLRTPELFLGGSDSDGCGSYNDTANRIYFTERSLNDDGNYVHVLAYESRAVTDTFYFGFEDLFRGGDNDFEDDFVMVEGLVPPCRPRTEVCDGADNDCDTLVDEADPLLDTACDPDPADTAYDLGECEPGRYVCATGALRCDGGVLPATEVCDGLDNDCDGDTDESDPAVGRACGSDEGACEFGATACIAGALECVGGRGPSEEVCDGTDNDCDTGTDEAFARMGLPCGIDAGECEPGGWSCVGGVEVCVGGTDPVAEICDSLDNDCDGSADEGDPGGGAACGSNVGECRFGLTACVAGALECAGGVGPTGELCDGLDNDCDAGTDEGNPGGGGPCGSSVGECTAGTLSCTGGRYECVGGSGPWEEECDLLDNDCDGVIDDGDPGGGAACGSDEGECESGVVRCIGGALECVGGRGPAPEACDCLDNDCDGLTDEEPLDLPCPDAAACIECTCLFPCGDGEFPCPPGKECDEDGYCHEGLCSGVTCAAGEVCRDGVCVDPCDGVDCPAGTVCAAGFCYENNCYALGCPAGEICVGGACIADVCRTMSCPEGAFCRLGECVTACGGVECAPGEVCGRDGACVSDACARVRCPSGEACVEGRCVADPCAGTSCGRGRVCVGGECVDDLCRFIVCPDGMRCSGDQCVGEPAAAADEWKIATGGGWFSCSAAAPAGPPSWGWLGLFVLGAAAVRSRRRRSNRGVWLAAVLSGSALAGSGCSTEPYCFGNCGAPDGSGGDGIDGDATGDGTVEGTEGGPVDGCTPTGAERCNLIDDDCDGLTDEGFDLATDVRNCGRCGVECVLPRATPACEAGVCGIAACDPGFHDIDGFAGNGCEYACVPRGDEVCDELDNDCDGLTDEDFDLDTDINHCGRCGFQCALTQAIAACREGACRLDSCLEGFVDVDGIEANGCEYNCTPSGPETCDLQDNDCDGGIDEGFDLEIDPGNCGACGRICTFLHASANCVAGGCDLGACDSGWQDADGRAINGCERFCEGASPETCDGVDNDCDGLTDEEFAEMGAPCGEGEGACVQGTTVCRRGVAECSGGVGARPEICDGLDNDCDGLTDEGTLPGTGVPCGSTEGRCEAGLIGCVTGGLTCGGAIGPRIESCNGLDDDCDGVTDEGDPGGGGPCGTDEGECRAGVERCLGGRIQCVGSVGPAASDSCDALDNDCDGFTDTAACLRLSAADVRLDRGATAGASNSAFPTAAAAGATSVTTAYLDLRNGNADIFGITSADSGATWPAADGRIDQSGVARPSVGPRMTAVGSNVFLAWEDFRDAATYRNIYFRRSTNAGASWAGSDLRLDTGLNTDSFNVSIAADAGGGVYVAWETMGNDRARHVYVARSTDSGATFGAPVRVDHNAISTPVAVCSEPQLAVNGAGTVYLAWRDNRNGKADIYFNRSTDRGATWVAADARLDTDPTSPGAFSTVPRVAATAAGRVVVVWQDDRTVGLDNALKVYANVSSDAGVTWRSADVRLDNPPGPADSFSPRLAVDPSTGRFVAVYQDGRNGLSDLYVRTSLDGVSWTAEARADADVAGFGSSANAAVVAAGGRAYVAWEEIRIDGGRRDIHFNYSFDGGLAFQPADLRFDAGTAGQYDSHDPVAVLQSGRLHVFWVDHRSGTGANGDIYTRYAY